jgi:hypothetical protein
MAEATATYAQDSGFVDRARHALQSGDPLPEAATAYARLREVVAARRETGNQAFAAVLRTWNEAGARGAEPVPVERLLDLIVAPLARFRWVEFRGVAASRGEFATARLDRIPSSGTHRDSGCRSGTANSD